ncbi:glycoside hydrolase family 13 protein [uncultured Dysosmobacter sp.]|uniref:glycoside hydrolase family 13 protein n=1 Tax=uncultured Dysosmobacter sp. TaxID=2591384 RepID=UPI00262B3085|nr:glycoside hydrolase family 13 protein [uncultured Dysosmobacter sp.]
MSEPFVFDPRSEFCKTPFGAVPCGHEIQFRCRPLFCEAFTSCTLVMHYEFSGTCRQVELSPTGPEGERTCFFAAVTAPEAPELIWYHFRLRRDDGTGCDLDKTGYRSDGLTAPWQITVYAESHTPQWFGSGVTYQIFPDRFCRDRLPDPTGLVGDRWVHENWSDAPAWQPDPDGEIRNRDFFGGTLTGIASKLPRLAEMGVGTLYLCPIFESASNHRYNTANYTKVDPMLGTEEDLKNLCAQARTFGIRVILDGVFNHTGSQSVYFNADGFYPSVGAAQSQDSPYYDWFSFHPWPDDYDAWWGIRTLPAVRENSSSYLDYVIEAPDSIVRRWLRCGISGWRLDVADELPDGFIKKVRAAVEETDPDAFLLGEVWEDASTKIAYSQRRKYLLGSELHGVMNYPFRTALLNYLRGGDADVFREAMETLRENYPPAAFYSAMNFLGTHDTARILTVLGADRVPETKAERAAYRLSPAERERGEALVKLAALVLFTFPGSPTVYYGDEMGMEGWEDPFNRGAYPWDADGGSLLPHFTLLGRLRSQLTVLQRGQLHWLFTAGPLLAFARELSGQWTATVVNASDWSQVLAIPWPSSQALDRLSGQTFAAADGTLSLDLPPRTGLFLT